MGFLSGITEKVFGGTDNSSQKAQIAQNARTQKFIEEQARINRGDALSLYPQADYARNSTINAAMGLMGRALPAQMGMFQGGNVAAQQYLLSGMPQYENALMGRAVDYSGMQPYRATLPDASSYQMQLPQFGTPQVQAMPQQTQQMQQPQQGGGGISPQMAMLLSGRF